MSADLRELASAPICGHVMATCRNEPGHPGDHWNPSVSVVAGVPDREPVGVEPGQGGPTDGFLDALAAAQDERDRLRTAAQSAVDAWYVPGRYGLIDRLSELRDALARLADAEATMRAARAILARLADDETPR